jgi:hypothetical protein
VGEFANDPAGHGEQGGVPEVLEDVEVGVEGEVQEIRLKVCDLEEGPEEVVETVRTDQVLELIEDLVHPPEEDLAVI